MTGKGQTLPWWPGGGGGKDDRNQNILTPLPLTNLGGPDPKRIDGGHRAGQARICTSYLNY